MRVKRKRKDGKFKRLGVIVEKGGLVASLTWLLTTMNKLGGDKFVLTIRKLPKMNNDNMED